MVNLIVAARNWADGGALSGGSWSATLPLTNLRDRQVTRIGRTTDTALASTQLHTDLGAGKLVSLVALLRHNFKEAGRWHE